MARSMLLSVQPPDFYPGRRRGRGAAVPSHPAGPRPGDAVRLSYAPSGRLLPPDGRGFGAVPALSPELRGFARRPGGMRRPGEPGGQILQPGVRQPLRRPPGPVSYTHLRAHETDSYLVCRLL